MYARAVVTFVLKCSVMRIPLLDQHPPFLENTFESPNAWDTRFINKAVSPQLNNVIGRNVWNLGSVCQSNKIKKTDHHFQPLASPTSPVPMT